MPNCPQGLTCPNLKDATHISMFRHEAAQCTLSCRACRDSEHNLLFAHPFNPLCDVMLTCQDQSKSHRSQFSHVCTWGGACDKLGDKDHCLNFYHFLDHRCPEADTCTNLNEDHLAAYTHDGIPDIREPCPLGEKCHQRLVAGHVKQYSHGLARIRGVSVVNPFALDHDAENAALNPGADPNAPPLEDSPILKSRIGYFQNCTKTREQLTTYAKANGQAVPLATEQNLLGTNTLHPFFFRSHPPFFLGLLKTKLFSPGPPGILPFALHRVPML